MTENNKEKTSTLTLKSGTLSIPKALEASKVKQNLAYGRSKTVTVVEKKHKTILTDKNRSEANYNISDKNNLGLTSHEQTARFNALKKASEQTEENKLKEEQRKIIEAEAAIEAEKMAKANPTPVEQIVVEIKTEPVVVKPLDEEDNKKKPYQAIVKNIKQSEESEESAESKAGKKVKKTDSKISTRPKWEDKRKVSLSTIAVASQDDGGRVRSIASIKRAREKAKRHEMLNSNESEKIIRDVIIPDIISVQELSARMAEKASDVIRELMKLGIMVGINHNIDADTAELVSQAFGHRIKRVTESDVENILIEEKDEESTLKPRPPVVTIMGHVDHGKTSLLDALRATDVAAGEAGGITQHIGAYSIEMASGDHITFLDTPGHEAFTAMRARGAKATDIVVLVVAADDGIKAQTVEAISHAKAAEVPIIIAINKIDKPEANVEKVKNELLIHGLVSEDLGGDVMIVEVSAKNKINLDKLEETILLQAEMLNLRANPDRSASGVVIETKVDKGRGIVTTILVQRGSLNVGDIVVAGAGFGRVKIMHDDKGKIITTATPSMPVEILGLSDAPEAGDVFSVVQSEKQAREIAEFRFKRSRSIRTTSSTRMTIEEVFSYSIGGAIKAKELPVIIKADVNGSIEAIASSITKLSNEEVKLRILHSAVGGISESDVSLCIASKAIILAFNVRASNQAKILAEKYGIDIRYYSIIYNLIDDIKLAMTGMLSPILREEYLGMVEIKQIYNITKVGKVAGSFVTSGIVKKGAKVRLLRDNIVIHEGKLKTLRRFKEDVREVKSGYECGIAFENYDDIREKDMVEVFEIIEEKKTL
jgi:translation initiation factor IF-2